MSIEGRTFTLKDEIDMQYCNTIEVYGVYASSSLFETAGNNRYNKFYVEAADSAPTITYITGQTEDEVYYDGWYNNENKTITFLNEPEYYLMDDSAVNEEVFIEWLESNCETEPVVYYNLYSSAVSIGGSIEFSTYEAAEGETVSITATPDPGYEFVEYDCDSSITITNNSFTMPAHDISIVGVFRLLPISGLVTDRQLTAIANAIREKGGTNDTLIFPDGFITAIQNLNVVNQN